MYYESDLYHLCVYMCVYLDHTFFISLMKPKLSFLFPNPCLLLGSLETLLYQFPSVIFSLQKHFILFYFWLSTLMQSCMLDTLKWQSSEHKCVTWGDKICTHLYAHICIHIDF